FYGTDPSTKEILMENYLICESFRAGEKMTLSNGLSVTMEDSLWVETEGITLCVGDSARNAAVRFGKGADGSFHTDGLFICIGGDAAKQLGRTMYLSETGQLTILPREGRARVQTYLYQPK
ncbi:MAG: hypothetical protein IJP37_01490, partial [Clostridia bacterium]|nr:hypothetical protein [Clostridia bacterium]